jgi:hypothetical protein
VGWVKRIAQTHRRWRLLCAGTVGLREYA